MKGRGSVWRRAGTGDTNAPKGVPCACRGGRGRSDRRARRKVSAIVNFDTAHTRRHPHRRAGAWRQRLRGIAPAALGILVLAGCGPTSGNTAAHRALASTTTAQAPVTIPGPWGIYQTGGHCAGPSTAALSFNVSPYTASQSETDIMASVDNLAALPVSLIAPRRLSVKILDAHNATVWSATMPALPTVFPNCTDARLTFTWTHATLTGQYTLELAVGDVQYQTSIGAVTEHVSPVTHVFDG